MRAAPPAAASTPGWVEEVLEPFGERRGGRLAGRPSRRGDARRRRADCRSASPPTARRTVSLRARRCRTPRAARAGSGSSAALARRSSVGHVFAPSEKADGAAPDRSRAARSRSAARWPRVGRRLPAVDVADDVERRVEAARAQRAQARRAAGRAPSPGMIWPTKITPPRNRRRGSGRDAVRRAAPACSAIVSNLARRRCRARAARAA